MDAESWDPLNEPPQKKMTHRAPGGGPEAIYGVWENPWEMLVSAWFLLTNSQKCGKRNDVQTCTFHKGAQSSIKMCQHVLYVLQCPQGVLGLLVLVPMRVTFWGVSRP